MKSLNVRTIVHLVFTLVIVSGLLVACQPGKPAATPGNEAPKTEVEPTSPPAPDGLLSASASAPQPEASGEDDCLRQPKPDCDIFRKGLISAEQGALDDLAGSSVYKIDFQIADDFLTLRGHQEVRYTNQEDEPLDEIYFQLFPNAAGGKSSVSAVKVDGADIESVDVKPVYEFEDTAVRVPLPEALQPGEQAVIQLDFEVEMAQEMEGNYGLFGYFEDVLVLDEFYPVIPVFDDEGWNVQAPPPNADTSYFDVSFYLVRVTAPAKLTVIATGIEVSRESEGDKQVLTFAAGPARDFYLAASEHYTVISEKVGETTVNSYAFAEREDGAKLALQVATTALKSFNERFGPYPYTEFDVVSTPMLALGIEYPGIVGMALAAYDLEAEVAGLPARIILESATAHEVGHQWFYNTVGSDQIDEPWVDEAVTQYVTGLYYLDAYGESGQESYRGSWYGRWDRVDQAGIPIGMPAAAYEGREYGAIVYGRGPIFLATLEEEMGRETFDEFLRDYYQTHKWGIGTGDAFKQLAEKHCGCDLTALFEEWVYEK